MQLSFRPPPSPQVYIKAPPIPPPTPPPHPTQAYIKARGDGLGFQPLSRASFSFPSGTWSTRAVLHVDGHAQPRWRFYLEELDNHHWIATARGPPECIEDPLGVRGGMGGHALDRHRAWTTRVHRGPAGGTEGMGAGSGVHGWVGSRPC